MRFVYPQGLRKALTFSYDDGQIYDRRLAALFRDHGMKATFHLNSGTLDSHMGNDIFVGKEELAEIYKGHEIACHGLQHRNPPTLTKQQFLIEIEEDRKELERLTGGFVQGMSYAFGNYSPQVIEVAQSAGIHYSRTVNATLNYYPPADFMEWHPTCHHSSDLKDIGNRFLNIYDFYELPLLYVWGHSFEFHHANNWEKIEAFVKQMEGKDDIWYATNGEIYDYISATRKQEFSADGLTMHNPTAISVWVKTAEGFLEIKPGETRYLGEH